MSLEIKKYRPEVIHNHVENTQDQHQHHSAELSLEAHHHHHTRNKPQAGNHDPAYTPVTGEDEADEEEYQEDTASELEIHLAVLLVDGGKTGGSEPLSDPAVGQHHQETAHDAKVAEEEVEIEDETVAEGLGDNHAKEAGDSLIAMFPEDDHRRTY